MSQGNFPYKNQKGNVRVTRTLLVINKIQYQIRNIDTITRTTIEPDTSRASNCILLGFLSLILGISGFTSYELLIAGLLTIAFGFAWLHSLPVKYRLAIATTGGVQFGYESENLQEIEEIQDALETAISLLF